MTCFRQAVRHLCCWGKTAELLPTQLQGSPPKYAAVQRNLMLCAAAAAAAAAAGACARWAHMQSAFSRALATFAVPLLKSLLWRSHTSELLLPTAGRAESCCWPATAYEQGQIAPACCSPEVALGGITAALQLPLPVQGGLRAAAGWHHGWVSAAAGHQQRRPAAADAAPQAVLRVRGVEPRRPALCLSSLG